ncbi:MAG: hypothetical protein Q7T11_06710 [Deltaproteobacteria bacterium]|nr:hypothetical protein [Deltaproteobacteria bacterium]
MKSRNRNNELERKMTEYRQVLKDDYDWDYAYILKLLCYKLARTRKCILKNNIVSSSKLIGRQIQTIHDLLIRVMEDDYDEEVSKEFYKKYGRVRMIFQKAEKGAKAIPVIFRYAKETRQKSHLIRKERRKLFRKADRMRARDLKRAFHLMPKQILSWWD